MRPLLLALVAATLVMATLAPAQGQAANGAPAITGFALSRTAVDLITDMGESVTFIVDATPDRDIAGVLVTLTSGGDRLQAPLSRTSIGTTTERWTGTLQVDAVGLLTGDWVARALAFDASGATAKSENITLQVRAANAPSLTIQLAGATSPVPRQLLGPDSVLRLNLTIDPVLLRNVTYRSSLGGATAPRFPLGTPFVVEAFDLKAGNQTLTFSAHDRLRRSATLAVPVLVDAVLPVIEVIAAPIAYKNLTTEVLVRVQENSSHSIILQASDGSHTGSAVTGGLVQFRFQLALANLGNQSYFITVTDALGNRATAIHNVTVLPVYTEAVVDLTTSGLPVKGEPVRFKVDVAQRRGVAPLDFDLNLTGPDTAVHLVAADVPSGGNTTVEFTKLYAPGKHALLARINAPDDVNVNDTSILQDEVPFEVFLGRITYVPAGLPTRTFAIRANADGLPQAALEPASSKIYAMTRANDTFDLIYEIRLSSNTTMRWDADEPVVTIEVPKPTVEPKKGIPAANLGLLALAALVCAAFAARRR